MNNADDTSLKIFYLLIGLALIFVCFILYSIAGLIIKIQKKYQQQSHTDTDNAVEENVVIVKKSSNGLMWIVVIIFILMCITLPFHYVPEELMVFPKDNLTFKYTIITSDDIEKLINRYNNSSFLQRQAMINEPIFHALMENQFLFESKK